MKILHIRNLLKRSGLSPEEMGQAAGISGMTLRRWLTQSDSTEIPKVYVPAIREACYELAAKGKLSLDDSEVQAVILVDPDSFQAQAVMTHLGLEKGALKLGDSSEKMLLCLNQIGVQKEKQEQVDAGKAKLFSLKKMGEEWSSRISILWSVIRSDQIRFLDKLVAYGALFYLLTPFDLIPDQIPVIGYMDDFIILGIAVSYYASRLKKLKKNGRP